MVMVESALGPPLCAIALIDPASEISIVNLSLVQHTDYSLQKSNITITGVGGHKAETSTQSLTLHIQSRTATGISVPIHLSVIRRLRIQSPSRQAITKKWKHLEGLFLANPNFAEPQEIEMILGANVYSELMLEGVSRGLPGDPIAQETKLGWIVTGAIPNKVDPQSNQLSLCSTIGQQISIDKALRRFWELEEIVLPQVWPVEDRCEQLFIKEHRRLPDGRYSVRLPIKDNVKLANIGTSLSAALRVLRSVHKRIKKDDHYGEEYSKFMTEYQMLNHMRVIEDPTISTGPVCYLAHHGIWQDTDQEKRKMRVVFSNKELNDLLEAGPPLQTDLVSVLIKWRQHAVVFSADIKMMYRQILVDPADVDLQRIVWENPDAEKVRHYQLMTLTYGTTCAPYLALRTLRQLAQDEGHRYPGAAQVLQTETYVDDVFTGASNITSAAELKDQLIGLLRCGGFQLRKWTSNDPRLMEDISEADRLRPAWHDFSEAEPVKALGVLWDPTSDTFRFRAPAALSNQPLTKSGVLGTIARLFDPMGWLAPMVIRAKIFMQELWKAKVDWNDQIPDNLLQWWITFCNDLAGLSTISISRWVGTSHSVQVEIHGFADASSRAYAAAIYMVVTNLSGSKSSNLLIAKTKVSPIKPVSIPRLELCAAVLLARLLHRVSIELKGCESSVHAWTDSQIVLAWLESDLSRWNVFVSNRVAEAQRESPQAIWRHVPSEENPADIASRGMSVKTLQKSSLWWNGPAWLIGPKNKWPSMANLDEVELPAEEAVKRKQLCFAVQATDTPSSFIDHFPTLIRLERSIARCIGLARRARAPRPRTLSQDPLSPQELEDAFLRCARLTQQTEFPKEIAVLQAQRNLPKRNPLRKLKAFLDEQGLIRVGGRLQKSTLPYSQKHPVILPKSCRLTDLVIDWAHKKSLHGGSNLTYSYAIQKAWIIHGRARTKWLIRRCVKCAQTLARPSEQLMGEQTEERVTMAPAFTRSGLDYAGPFHIKASKVRGARVYKGYLAIFVCLSTKAVNIEVVGDLTTESYLAALRRFVAKNETPVELWSDNATTFHGADIALKAMFREARIKWSDVADEMANDGILWQFIPPAAPHFGGLWEAAVKSAKTHVKRVIGEQILTYEEFNTLVKQIERAMNSRPLTPLTAQPDDLDVLTPSHFLTGPNYAPIPDGVDLKEPPNYRSRWKLVQHIYHHFWDRWSREYLHTLQQRVKWTRKTQNLKVDDMVLVLDPTLSHHQRWPLGRVLETHPGADGLVRVATIRTSRGTYKRPITKLHILPKESE